jgi:acyl carrier protein
MKILAALAIGSFLWVLYLRRESTKQAEVAAALFSGREALSMVEFHEKYFKAQGVSLQVVERVVNILAQQLGTDMSRLSGDDAFKRELKELFYDDLIEVEILKQLEKAFSIKITDFESSQVQTVSDLVNLVASKVRG